MGGPPERSGAALMSLFSLGGKMNAHSRGAIAAMGVLALSLAACRKDIPRPMDEPVADASSDVAVIVDARRDTPGHDLPPDLASFDAFTSPDRAVADVAPDREAPDRMPDAPPITCGLASLPCCPGNTCVNGGCCF